MKIFVFKTNVQSQLEMSILASALKNLRGIIRWSIDMQDIDRVLKIVALDDSNETYLMDFVRSQGIYCEALPD